MLEQELARSLAYVECSTAQHTADKDLAGGVCTALLVFTTALQQGVLANSKDREKRLVDKAFVEAKFGTIRSEMPAMVDRIQTFQTTRKNAQTVLIVSS